jgi:hypothetical protein
MKGRGSLRGVGCRSLGLGRIGLGWRRGSYSTVCAIGIWGWYDGEASEETELD